MFSSKTNISDQKESFFGSPQIRNCAWKRCDIDHDCGQTSSLPTERSSLLLSSFINRVSSHPPVQPAAVTRAISLNQRHRGALIALLSCYPLMPADPTLFSSSAAVIYPADARLISAWQSLSLRAMFRMDGRELKELISKLLRSCHRRLLSGEMSRSDSPPQCSDVTINKGANQAPYPFGLLAFASR